MNYKDFPKHPIDYIISILICFCVLFLCFSLMIIIGAVNSFFLIINTNNK